MKIAKKWGAQMEGIIREGKKSRRYCTLSSLAKALNLMITPFLLSYVRRVIICKRNWNKLE